ncbi:MAG TPA: TRAP transporter substrate-binding protein DctP [Gemmatimonadaceae bacterium]|nr:TRAP transporter substrate-binding protein DctP [Gemmatimonadaceae bacterium]
MSVLKRFFLYVLPLVLAPALLLAAPGEIKLATLVPANTSWHKALLDMGNTWNKDTSGRVTLTVYPGGTQGDESTTIKKMRSDILQASFLTAAGLAELDDAFNVFAMPFFFESDEEEMAVEKKLTPLLDQKLQAKGFHLLSWGTGGWVQVFSKKPLRSLADVKAAKLFTTKGADKWLQWYVANGFHPVALLPADIPTQLKVPTGLIDTAPNPPYLALSLQIFRDAKYMLDLHIAPLTGAMIISNTAWNGISAEDKPKVSAGAQALEKRVRAEAPAQDAESVKQMVARGLQVITLDPKAAAEFRTAATQLVSTMRGSMVPADVFDMAVQERDALRKSKGK